MPPVITDLLRPPAQGLQQHPREPEEEEDFDPAVEVTRAGAASPRPPLPPLLLLTVLLLLLLLLGPGAVLGMRGPHHPRGEVVAHTHYRPQPDSRTKLTHDSELLHDKDHIREDLGEWATQDVMNKMSPDELEFHYFKLHDLDNNTKLDGLEILHAIQHTVHADEHTEHENEDQQTVTNVEDNFSYYIDLIDQVLHEDDQDNDGYLSYAEYVLGRQQNKRNAAQLVQTLA